MVDEDGPDDFEFKDDDSAVVRAFKENKIHMWFREPLPEDSIIHHLPLKD
jgi:hypothetical protein